jgi:hypothetical protein
VAGHTGRIGIRVLAEPGFKLPVPDRQMFYQATTFNQNIGGWNVATVSSTEGSLI